MATPTTGRSGAVIVGDIEGGEAPTRKEMDDNLIADDLYNTYRRYPTYKDIIKLDVDAVWSNYLSEETIKLDRIIELKDGMEDAVNYGWSIIIVDATSKPPRCERWHPKIDGTGCEITKTSMMGFPLEVQIQARFNESSSPINYKVEHYPCKVNKVEIGKDGEETIYSYEYDRDKPIPGQRGFFLIRTRGGKKGIRGLPKYLNLIMLIRKVYDIIENYCTYAENQALGTLMVGLERNTKPNRTSIKTQVTTQPTHRKMIIIGKEDWADWVSPMNSSWDPWSMLEYIDKLIARATQMNKLMLEGDPAGYLSASETTINNWISKVKERQAYWIAQFLPIFIALGATNEITFKDPSKPTFVSLMEGLKSGREALIDIVTNEDIVRLFNEYLEKHGHKEELTAISNEEMSNNNGNFGQSEDNNGSQASREE
jgi:hypothetical protein